MCNSCVSNRANRPVAQRLPSSSASLRGFRRPYRLFHDIYVLLDDGDRQTLNEYGLNPSQYGLLTTLRAGEGERLTLLSQRLLLSKSTITRVVDQLERAGIVRRVPDSDDRRAQRVVLTRVGLEIRDRITAGHTLSLRRRLSVLSAAEREKLGAILDKLRQGLIADLSRKGNGKA